MPNIVVEGPDAAGKSTLMETLRATAGRRYFAMLRHSCRPYSADDALRFYDILKGSHKDITLLIDRHPMISEPIYGPILRGTDLLGRISTDRLIEMLVNSCDRIIYCRPPEKTIREKLSAQPQLAGVFDKIDRLIDAYDRAMDRIGKATGIPVIHYDWTTIPTTEETHQKVFGP